MDMEIPMKILSDEKGYLDRQCPNKNCLFKFKVNMDDWKEKISDDEVHCPLCGHTDTSDCWYTNEQVEAIKENAKSWAMNYIQNELSKSFEQLERSMRHNKFVKITYNPGKPISFVNNPIGAKEEWALDITCEKCGTRYSVIGSAFFCPCCGYNSASNTFNESIDNVLKMVQSIDEMSKLLNIQFGQDKAETMCRSLIENSIGQIVSAFQKFAQCVMLEISGKEKRVNDFQIVDKGSNLFLAETGKGYDEWLSPDELNQMKVYFQKRHIIEHNAGIVDRKYIEQSNDNSYLAGQRIVVKSDEPLELIEIIKKLATGLLSLRTNSNNGGIL